MRHLIAVVALFLVVFGATRIAIAAAPEPRVALVIGNSAYEDAPLANPVNDARLMAETLRGLGFDVIERTDANQKEMKLAIFELEDRLEAAGKDAVGLFYYAGHGVQLGGQNYLIPLNAQIEKAQDVAIEAVGTSFVLNQMEFAGNRINIVILDAARNNPFTDSAGGLAQMIGSPGTLIAYSTSPGGIAMDGVGPNSPYTSALAREMQKPGVRVDEMFRQVRLAVMAETNDAQVPSEVSWLTEIFYFRPSGLADSGVEIGFQKIQEEIRALRKDIDQTRADAESPIIQVTSPIEIETSEEPYEIIGLVADNGSAPRLTVNGDRVPLFERRSADPELAKYTRSLRVPVEAAQEGEKRFVLEACDAADNCIAKEVVVTVVVANRPSIKGKNYALIIGNNEYQHLDDLDTAVNDATALAELLTTRFAFDEERITLLTDADRNAIMEKFKELRKNLSKEDRLLVYYAGHGQIDPASTEGFWQPVDAELGKEWTWIANDDIKRNLLALRAKHVLVLADSCFAGSLLRATSRRKFRKDRFFAETDDLMSRTLITSGGTEPVSDSGFDGHSIFAYYLLKSLRELKKPYMTSSQLFEQLVTPVTNNSKQKPRRGTVYDTGDEGGDFTFILRRKTGSATLSTD